MARFTEIMLRERPYLAPMKDWFAIAYALEDAAFIAALQRSVRDRSRVRRGVKAQRLVEAAYESARLGAPVEITN